MKKSTTWIIIAIVIVLVGAYGVFQMNGAQAKNYDDFAKCLNGKGVKMYGAFWCTHCQAEKKLFGDSWQYMNYVECSTTDGKSQLPVCAVAGIQGYPTWDFGNDLKIPGELSMQELGQRTGCELPK